jgi:uncharacterized protein
LAADGIDINSAVLLLETIVKTTITDEIGELLKKSKNIAVVGLSDSPLRPSYGVSAYMQSHGYHIVPVNPAIWLQEGVIHEEAAEKARKAGIFVVMDLCILKEHRRRFS